MLKRSRIITPNNLFIGIYPGGVVYADKTRKEHGDYKRLAFLPWNTLIIRWDMDKGLSDYDKVKSYDERVQWVKLIWAHARPIIAMKGQDYPISGCGQNVRLGGAK